MKWDTLGNICEITSSKRVFESEWQSSGVPFYRAREIVKLSENDSVDNELFISEEMYSKYSQKYGYPQEGDIMVTGVGTLGISYRVRKNDKFYFKDGNIIWLKDFAKGVDSRYVNYLFQSDIVKDQVRNSSAGGTVGPYTITNAKKTKIPLPAFDVQVDLSNKAEKEDLIISMNKELIMIMESKISEVLTSI